MLYDLRLCVIYIFNHQTFFICLIFIRIKSVSDSLLLCLYHFCVCFGGHGDTFIDANGTFGQNRQKQSVPLCQMSLGSARAPKNPTRKAPLRCPSWTDMHVLEPLCQNLPSVC